MLRRIVEFRVEVKTRERGAKPYRWEIYAAQRPLAIVKTRETFANQAEAERAGEAALDLWLKGKLK